MVIISVGKPAIHRPCVQSDAPATELPCEAVSLQGNEPKTVASMCMKVKSILHLLGKTGHEVHNPDPLFRADTLASQQCAVESGILLDLSSRHWPHSDESEPSTDQKEDLSARAILPSRPM